ncbi:MAG: glutathione S-transferase C-terminal domain-containing protein [Leptolyngbyaceae cyanobacterium]
MYNTVNNGVYKCGFATTQAAYKEALIPLFDSLDWLEEILAIRRYLTGDQLTEADW